jgi:hypothetical protein
MLVLEIPRSFILGVGLVTLACQGPPGSIQQARAAIEGSDLPPTVSAGEDTSVNEASTTTLTATASDPENETLTYQWTYRAEMGFFWTPRCTFGSPSAASTSLTCDNDGVVFATVTVSDGVNPPVSDEVRVDVLDVPAAAQLLAPPSFVVAQKGSFIDGLLEIQEPVLADIPACLLFRLTDESQRNFVRPAVDDQGRTRCAWHTTYPTQLTGQHLLIWQLVQLAQFQDVFHETQIVVWSPDPTESASGEGDLTIRSNPAHVELSVGYPSTTATRPTGMLQFHDPAAGINFLSRDFDWFAFQRDDRFAAEPDVIVLSGHGKNRGDHGCAFSFQARGPKPPAYDAGERSGEVRIRIECGTQVYDTDPVFQAALTPLTTGSIHLVYPPAP